MVFLVGLKGRRVVKGGGLSFPLKHIINHSPKLEGKWVENVSYTHYYFTPFFSHNFFYPLLKQEEHNRNL